MGSGTLSGSESRIERAQALLAEQRLDGLLALDLLNVRYLCGFTGSNGLLLVLEEKTLFFTDSRYTLQAREEIGGIEVVQVSDADRAVAEALNRRRVAYTGVQAKSLSAVRWNQLRRMLESDLVDLGTSIDALRINKDPDEVHRLRETARLAEEALGAVLPRLIPGRTEADVARQYHVEALKRGADGLSFDTIVAGGPRGALPHAKPGLRSFADGDLVVFDFGVRLDGYCSDETVTVPVGEVGAETREVYDVVFHAQAAALDRLKAGIKLSDVDQAARDVIGEAGYGEYFGHGTGHGVGLAVHEAPTVSSRSEEVAQNGMVVTLEPGIYVPGRFGVRLEDTVYVTEEGCERITSVPKDFGAVLNWPERRA